MMDIIESILILMTGTKFIIPLTVSLFGSYVRILQRPYATTMTLFYLRLILSIIGGILIFMIIEKESDLLLLLASVCCGYLSIDMSDVLYNIISKRNLK